MFRLVHNITIVTETCKQSYNVNIPESSSLGYYAKDIYLDIIIIVAFEEYKSISDCI